MSFGTIITDSILLYRYIQAGVPHWMEKKNKLKQLLAAIGLYCGCNINYASGRMGWDLHTLHVCMCVCMCVLSVHVAKGWGSGGVNESGIN